MLNNAKPQQYPRPTLYTWKRGAYCDLSPCNISWQVFTMRGKILREFNKKSSSHKTSFNEFENLFQQSSIPKLDHAIPPSSGHLAGLMGVPQHLHIGVSLELSVWVAYGVEWVSGGGYLNFLFTVQTRCYLNADIIMCLPLRKQLSSFPIPNVGLAVTIATAD